MHLIFESRRLVVAAVLCAAALGSGPVSAAEGSDAASAAATVQSFHDALKAGDAVAAMAWLAPGATVLEQGSLESRSAYGSHHLAADIRFARAVSTERKVTHAEVAGDLAWLVASSVTQGMFEGRAVNLNGAEMVVMTRNGPGWLIQAIHWSSRTPR